MASIERPGDKDILVGRGHTVFNHIGNRRFRQLVDLYIQLYVESGMRSEKTAIVRKVIDVLYQSGYRFLKPDEEGVFAELEMQYVLKKVGHALRDRSPLLEQHLSRNLKNLDTLRDEKLCPMSYAEAVTSGEEQDVWRKERYYTLNSENRLRQLWVRPRGFTPGGKLDTRDAASAASCLLKLSAVKKVGKEEVEAAEKKKAEAGGSPNKTLAEKNSTSATSSTLKRKKPAAMTATTAQNTNKASLESGAAPAKKKYIKSVNDIVVPTMQNGSLPIGGNWKFFPLPELQSKIDLGPTDKGWKLKLRPIAFTADTITLNVDPS